MPPPLDTKRCGAFRDGRFLEINDLQIAKTVIESLKDSENQLLYDALISQRYDNLFDKPKMTSKDKEGMQKTIDFIVAKNLDTPKNLKKLEAIIYTEKYIEIGGIKRARKDLKAESKSSAIYQYGRTTYFKLNKYTIEERNRKLAGQGMKIPLDEDYNTSMQALPGEYVRYERYVGGNILALITDMKMSGRCDADGSILLNDEMGYRGGVHVLDKRMIFFFGFGGDDGFVDFLNGDDRMPIRPIYK